MIYKLRLLDFVGNHVIHALPVVFSGTVNECDEYASRGGYEVRFDNSVIGWRLTHPETGNVLYPTL